MAVVTRPTKPVGGGSGTAWVAGARLTAQELNDDYLALLNDYNGSITDANCSATMGLQGSKLADSPNGIATAKINDKAVTGVKIANDAAVDASRAITTDHIKDANVTLPKVKTTTVLITNSVVNITSGSSLKLDSGKSSVTTIPLVGYMEGTTAALAVGIAGSTLTWNRDTTTNTWWLTLRNTGPITINYTGIVFSAKFLET